ncbi:MAG: adenylate kinase family protein [Candidatus Bathyarchaeota archaeon]|nr:adenylate kinase family protein [Candidatus Bathyarchaeota archaeon]
MNKRVILITGTPRVGKTTISHELTKKLNAQYINLTDLAEKENLTTSQDKTRKTTIINETKMRRKLNTILNNAQEETIIIDGHYAAAVTPKKHVTHVFVLRRNPIELQEFMQKSSFSEAKLWENLAAEILDACLIEAIQYQGKDKVCELDITGKTAEDTTNEIIAILNNRKQPSIGSVDWLDMLEREGKTEEYLRF